MKDLEDGICAGSECGALRQDRPDSHLLHYGEEVGVVEVDDVLQVASRRACCGKLGGRRDNCTWVSLCSTRSRRHACGGSPRDIQLLHVGIEVGVRCDDQFAQTMPVSCGDFIVKCRLRHHLSDQW
eukprot:4723909-Amphidinium_carterae.2